VSPDEGDGRSAVAQRLERMIAGGGPIPLGLFMAYANAHYYATRDPLGAGGDFITAPEISQMFGELIGLWAADLWSRSGGGDVVWVELGPGRGTLSADARRAVHRFGWTPEVHLVETSPVLRDLQAVAVPDAHFHDDVSTLPADRPLIIVANEFFDALPIRQLVRTADGWRERMVDCAGGRFFATLGTVPMEAAVPPRFAAAPPGSVLETSPPTSAVAADIAQTLASQGGALLAIDYGYPVAAVGDTLQAMRRHGFTDPFAAVGDSDLTAHVDFGALADIGRAAGLRVSGPVGQGAFLDALGLTARADSLIARHPDRAEGIAGERARLADADQMGTLFKALAMVPPGWPQPEGFAR
jgi:SAM-dependent MidA family methyltransferase